MRTIPEIVERATKHEFGDAHVPERSFIRAGWDSNADDIFEAAETWSMTCSPPRFGRTMS